MQARWDASRLRPTPQFAVSPVLHYTPHMPNPHTVYLIRHATPDRTRRDIPYDVPPGPPLSPEGRQEAYLMAAHLANAGIRQIFASIMDRAHETATILGTTLGRPVLHEPALLEIPNGTRLADIHDRMVDMWQRLVLATTSDGAIALVSHGGPITALLQTVVTPALDLDPFTRRFDSHNPLPPAGVWELTRRNDASWQGSLLFYPAAIDMIRV